jgi:predicted GIY-YIG superfamily endonuclease
MIDCGRNPGGAIPAFQRDLATAEKRFVYILRSDSDPQRHYTGITSEVVARLECHNHGPCGCTTRDRSWSLAVSIEFRSEASARRFERDLKSRRRASFTSDWLSDIRRACERGGPDVSS